MDEGLTPRLLQLPKALAAKYAVPDTNAYEELVSAGYEGLMVAYRSYDGSKGATLFTWAYRWVKALIHRASGRGDGSYNVTRDGTKRFVMRHEQRWRSLLSLDEPVTEGGRHTRADFVADAVSADAVEADDLIDRLLSRLRPMQRAALIMYYVRGLQFSEIGDLLGVCRQTASQIVRGARARARRVGGRVGCRSGGGAGGVPPRTDRQRQASAAYQREKASAARKLGRVPAAVTKCWYLVDDAAKALAGPSKSVGKLLARHGIVTVSKGPGAAAIANDKLAGHGWRLARGPEARRLAEFGGYAVREVLGTPRR